MKKYVLSERQYSKLRNILLETRLRTYIFDWDDNINVKVKQDQNGVIDTNCKARRIVAFIAL